MVILLVLLVSLPLGAYLVLNVTRFFPRAARQQVLARAKYHGYIVQFRDPPALEVNADTRLVDKEQTAGRRANLTTAHAQFKKAILKDLGKSSFAQAPAVNGVKGVPIQEIGLTAIPILGEYTDVFNGIALKISDAQAKGIAKEPFVKRVAPNYEVQATLMDSVPLINAEKVWQIKDAQGRAVTGEGVNVAVIDTGVDYTHPDLGKTNYPERPFDLITGTPLKNDVIFTAEDQIMAVDKDRLAYIDNGKISIYSFATKTVVQPKLYDDKVNPFRIALKDNLLAYVAEDYKDANAHPIVYLTDLNSNVQEKISPRLAAVGQLNIEGGKVIYGAIEDGSSSRHIYLYNLATKEKTILSVFDPVGYNYEPFVWNNKVVESNETIEVPCPDKIIVYNLETKTERDIAPSDVGPVRDFRDDKILYGACDKDSGIVQGVYYLYDLAKDRYQRLALPGSLPASTVYNGESTGLLAGNILKGKIQNGLIYFFAGTFGNFKIAVYDAGLNRYAQINLHKSSPNFDAYGNHVCFLTDDWEIYCHTYDPQYPYAKPVSVFNDKIVGGYNFIDLNDDPFDDAGHGTHVASIIASNGNLKGVAPGAKIIAYKVLSRFGSGSMSDIMAAIDKAVQTRSDHDRSKWVDVINMSLGANCGQYDPDCGPDDPLSQAANKAVDAGITVVVSAGNGGDTAGTIGSPGTAKEVITVAAATKDKQIASFSSRGPVIWQGEDLHKPDIAAPGVGICAARSSGGWMGDKTCFDNQHILLSGTSMAAPHIAGVVALLQQAHPDWKPIGTKDDLRKTAADLGFDKDAQGAGLADALAAVYGSRPAVSPSPISSVPATSPTPSTSPVPTNTASPSASPSPTPTGTPITCHLRGNPTMAMSPASASSPAGGLVAYTVSITNNDSADCSASQFGFYAFPLPVNWKQTPQSQTVSVSAGKTEPVGVVVTSSQDTPAGTYGLVEAIYDPILRRGASAQSLYIVTPSSNACTASCVSAATMGTCQQSSPCKTTDQRTSSLPSVVFTVNSANCNSGLAIDTSLGQFSQGGVPGEVPWGTWWGAAQVNRTGTMAQAQWNFCNSSVCWTFDAGQTLYWRIRDLGTGQVKAVCPPFGAPATASASLQPPAVGFSQILSNVLGASTSRDFFGDIVKVFMGFMGAM